MKILLLFSGLLLLSCSKNDTGKSAQSIDVSLVINLKDSVNNENLIGTATYPEDNVIVTYLINGNIVNLSQGELPRILNDELPKRIAIFLNNNESEEYPITYVKWNDTDTDTIKAHFIRGDGFLYYDKVWINDVEVTNFEEPGHYYNLLK